MKKQTVVVTGAGGHLGQLVIKELLKHNKVEIIATTRDAKKITFPVTVKEADFNQSEKLVAAFKGADRLLLISTDAIGSRVEQHKNAIQAAVTAGVKHIIYTSWPSPETSKALVGPDHAATELLIKQSGLSYTILRNYYYSNNLLQALPTAVAMGTLYGTAGEGKVAYITREDCAKAAAGALEATYTDNKILDITGPRAVNYDELAAILSEVVGKKIPYVDLPENDFKQALLKSGLPEIWADVFVSFDLANRANEVEKVSGAVEAISGQKPQDIEDFLRENKKILIG